LKARAEAATLVLSLGLTGFVVMADNWVVSPILPSIGGSIGTTPIQAAILIPAYMLPLGLLQLFYDPLADRYGKLKVLRVAMIGFTIGWGQTAAGASLTGLTAYRALTGAFAAATNPVSLALIGDTVRSEDRQSAIGLFLGISFLGQGLSMEIDGMIAYFVSWHGVFAAYEAFSLLVTALLIAGSRSLPVSGWQGASGNGPLSWLGFYPRLWAISSPSPQARRRLSSRSPFSGAGSCVRIPPLLRWPTTWPHGPVEWRCRWRPCASWAAGESARPWPGD
jgi:MFS family permease